LTTAEDRLVSAEELRACVTLDGPLDYDAAHRYGIGLDVGLKDDRTVLTVARAEWEEGAPRVGQAARDRIHCRRKRK
jgi:hypothetical protein